MEEQELEQLVENLVDKKVDEALEELEIEQFAEDTANIVVEMKHEIEDLTKLIQDNEN